jgi:hypothetical protein
MQFDLIRLVLVSRAQTSLFMKRSETGELMTREHWLREIFSKEMKFSHRGHEYHYIPEPIDANPTASRFLAGRIGRQFKTVENEPPEAGFQETIREPWQASTILIDPSHHPDH